MTIGEFSKRTEIKCSTLRYYENEGLIRVERDAAHRRDYSESDIEWANFLQRLKNTGMSLKNMKLYSDLRYEGESTMQKRLDLLCEHRKYVDKQIRLWQEYSDNLNEKISSYEKQIQKQ